MLTCPKCGYEWNVDEMNYCKNCGTCLHNYCSNPKCPLTEEFAEPVEFSPKDCFCYECGSKTTFYEAGFIEPDLK